MQAPEGKLSLDVDFLFDNFEEFCEVEFQREPSRPRQPPIFRNLGVVFDQVAYTHSSSKEALYPPNTLKQPTKQKVVKGSDDKIKRVDKDYAKKTTIAKKKLKLNLKDVFSANMTLRHNKTAFDSTKSGGLPFCNKTSLLNFIRTKTEALNTSQQREPLLRTGSRSRSKSKGGKSNTKHSCVKPDNIFKAARDEVFRKAIQKNSSKPSLGQFEHNLPTASTRVPATSRNGSNKRSSSFMETEGKLKHQSTRNLRTDSFMATATINSILNSSKNLQYKLLKRAKEREIKTTQPRAKPKGQLKTQATSSAARDTKDSPVEKKRSETKSKYYIPGHIGFKGQPKHCHHNSFAHSEELSQGGKSNYLHKVLFPKMLGKLHAEESVAVYSKRRSRQGTSSRIG